MPTDLEESLTIENLADAPHPALRWLELLFLFGAVPVLFWLWRQHPQPVADLVARLGLEGTRITNPGRFMIPTLALFTLFALALLLLDRSFRRRHLWNFRAAVPELPRILIRFALLGAGLTVLAWQLELEAPLRRWLESIGLGYEWLGSGANFFGLPRNKPTLWLVIMVFYPVVSVWPQEVLYRAFFFHRYSRILTPPVLRVAVSGLAFGFMHIVFMNPVAPTLCVLGGWLFAHTYERTRSTFAASLEHALYGCCVFTVGLGSYFYGGTYGGAIVN